MRYLKTQGSFTTVLFTTGTRFTVPCVTTANNNNNNNKIYNNDFTTIFPLGGSSLNSTELSNIK